MVEKRRPRNLVTFGNLHQRKAAAKRRLRDLPQPEGRSCRAHLEQVQILCRKADPEASEEEIIRWWFRSAREEAINLVTPSATKTLEGLREATLFADSVLADREELRESKPPPCLFTWTE